MVHRHPTQFRMPGASDDWSGFLSPDHGKDGGYSFHRGSTNYTTWTFNHPGFQFYQVAQSKQESMGSDDGIYVYGSFYWEEDPPSRAGFPKQ